MGLDDTEKCQRVSGRSQNSADNGRASAPQPAAAEVSRRKNVSGGGRGRRSKHSHC